MHNYRVVKTLTELPIIKQAHCKYRFVCRVLLQNVMFSSSFHLTMMIVMNTIALGYTASCEIISQQVKYLKPFKLNNSINQPNNRFSYSLYIHNPYKIFIYCTYVGSSCFIYCGLYPGMTFLRSFR